MEMLKSEQESIDLGKVMMQSLEGCSMSGGGEYMNGVNGRGSGEGTAESPSPSTSFPQSMKDLLGGLVNPSQLIANNMDSSSMASLLEQMASIQSQLLTSQSLPFLSSHSSLSSAATPSKEAYCDLCDKTFCNRSFLRNHRLNKHGVDEGGSPVKKKEEESTSPIHGMEGGRNSSVIRERSSVEGTTTDRNEGIEEEKHRVSSSGDGMKVEGGGSCSLPSIPSLSALSKCDECPFETDNFLTLLQHKTLVHVKMEQPDETPLNTVTPPSTFACTECDSSFESSALLSHHSALVHSQFGPLLNMFSGGDPSTFPSFLLNAQLPMPFASLGNSTPVVKPPPAKRNYSSAGKNYCDVCNKEVCNKYFLRTHMLKMHGIVIDENKPVIANIDTRERERTGELTFRCDMCSVTLSSRQQLREHKEKSHGVSYPVGTPSSHSSSQSNGGLSTPTRPSKNLTMHPPPSMMVSLPTMASSSISSLDLSSLVSDHSSSALSSSIDHTPPHTLLSADAINELASMSSVNGREGGGEIGTAPAGMAKCHHCLYTTKYARNMEYHVERHERLNEVEGGNGGGVIRMEMSARMEEREEEAEREREREERERRRAEEQLMTMTTSVALDMMKNNQTLSPLECTKCHRSFSTETFLQAHIKLFHSNKVDKALAQLALKRTTKLRLKRGKGLRGGLKTVRLIGEKDKEKEIHGVERHSVTSGSISPLRSDLPEGHHASSEPGYSLQPLLFSTPLGLPLPPQFTVSLPMSTPLLTPLSFTVTLNPLIPS